MHTPISLDFPQVMENELPLPYVYYPDHYGTFFGFSESENSSVFMCLCNKDLIENYLNIRRTEDVLNYTDKLDNAPLSAKTFPRVIAEKSLEKKFVIDFREKICHRCNLKTPTLRYCHEMYGGKFKQHFGWYINQSKLRYSFTIYDNTDLSFLPQELQPTLHTIYELESLKSEKSLFNEPFNKKIFLEIYDLDKNIARHRRKIDNYYENLCREEFGFRKIGEGNVSELLLAKIIEQIFTNTEIIMHYRPKWLGGLELDIYIPNLQLAFEYQGQQHFHSIKAWGGEKALNKIQERDALKRKICETHTIKLIEVDYTEPLEINYIREKIQKYC